MYLYSHNPLSQSASALANELGIPRIRHERSRFKGAPHKVVINWGAHSVSEEIAKCQIINAPLDVHITADKLSFFQMLIKTNLTPPFTTDKEVVEKWLKKDYIVFARTLLNSSGGKGIIAMGREDAVQHAPLYVRYVPKRDEYRVHIVGDRIVDIQQKKRRLDASDPNWKIRNHNNGFIYAREGCFPPTDVSVVAMETFKHFDLDFGAVDVIWNEKREQAYALEINTAPGLEGQTTVSYADAFREYLLC